MKLTISQEFRGVITLNDILLNTATLILLVDPRMLLHEVCLFEIEHENFHFSLTVSNGQVIFRRGMSSLVACYPHDIPMDRAFYIVPVWKYGALSILLRPKGLESYYVEMEIEAVATPVELIKYVRKMSLIPVETYSSSREFAERIYSGIGLIQNKLSESDSYNSFWNLVYEGNRIVSKIPKRETEIQPLIHAMLSDQFFLGNIEIIPEHHGGDGDLDFMFIGHVSGYGACRLCVEFKLAHSKSLSHGLQVQLPKYMESRQAEYGLYCVLDFYGKDFKDSPEDLHYLLEKMNSEVKHHSVATTRIMVISFAKPVTASK